MLLPIHVAAGALALVLGAVALLVRKGGTLHRRSGHLFVAGMAVMGVTAALLGDGSGGWMAVYFVGTALTTVRPPTPWTRAFDVAAAVFAVVYTLVTLHSGVEVFASPGRSRDGVPFVMFFFLATVTALAAAGDLRILRRGALRGRPRLARHLWRMCFALFVAAASFFSIRERVAKILPEPFTSAPLRLLPVLLVLAAMLYWLWRLRGERPAPVLVRHG